MLYSQEDKSARYHILLQMHMIFQTLFQCSTQPLHNIPNSTEYSLYSFSLDLDFKKCHDNDGILILFSLDNMMNSISNLYHKTIMKSQARRRLESRICVHLDMLQERFTLLGLILMHDSKHWVQGHCYNLFLGIRLAHKVKLGRELSLQPTD